MKTTLGLALTVLMANAMAAEPPIAAKHLQVLNAPSGVPRKDDYFWLRDDQRNNKAVLEHLEAENAYVDQFMSPLKPLAQTLYQELVGRIKQDDSSVPTKQRGYWYYSRYEAGQDHPVRARRKGTMQAPEEILLNVNEMAVGKDFFEVGAMVVSQDNHLMAWAEDDVGRNQQTIRFRDLRTGEVLPDVLTGTSGNLVWADDNRTVLYVENNPQTLRAARVKKHELGTPTSTDLIVHEEQDDTFTAWVGRTRDDRFITISAYSTLSRELRYAPANDPAGFTLLAPRERGVEYDADHVGGRWLIRTNDAAKNFKLVTAPSHATSRAQWQDLVAHDGGVFVEDFQGFSTFIAVGERSGGLKRIRLVFEDGRSTYLPAEESVYSMSLEPDGGPDTVWLRYQYSSLTTPYTVLELNTSTGERRQLKQTPVIGYDASNYVTERQWVIARDGTKVPVSLVYRKGYRKDGSGALYQAAYGSYGISFDPQFDPTVISLLDRGVVYAIAHVRGGQEMGRDWYESGKLLRKQNTFNDFIDVTRALVKDGWAAENRVVAAGGSAGGLLMGAVANQAAQDYRVMVAQVPFVDVLTSMLDENLPLTTGEYDEWGNPHQKGFYDYMLAYSPYDNVRKQAYPAMFVTTGLWDAQVQYWEPAKWVAKLREYNRGHFPILFRTRMQSGHAGNSGRFEYFREMSEVYAFVLQQLGIQPTVDELKRAG